jgi:hypothetical protein
VRLILFFLGTVSALAVGVSQGFIPLPAQMAPAVRGLGGDPTHAKTVNFSPVGAYNRVLPEILKGNTPEEPSLHGTPVTKSSGNIRGVNSAAVNAAAAAQNGFASGLVSQMQQNQRMQDTATDARNPAASHGALPH